MKILEPICLNRSRFALVCRALADQDINILALHSFPIATKGKFVTRFIVDNPNLAKAIINREQLTYVETEIVQIKIRHRPGEIARVTSRLGKADININYVYCGLEPGTNDPLIFLGVTEVGRAASLLEHALAKHTTRWRDFITMKSGTIRAKRTRSCFLCGREGQEGKREQYSVGSDWVVC